MVYNDPERPEIARESQDVETPPLRVEEAPHHTGRGMSFLWFYGSRGDVGYGYGIRRLTEFDRWCRECVRPYGRRREVGA